ncbi:MAG: hypothetical protein IKN73_01710 [Alphaproteobacteria bacterium]|nr:hypothetical protein [Alphaproteobacteria bacterium]
MDKSKKIKKATRLTRNKNIKQNIKKVLMFPWTVLKAMWLFICRVCNKVWNWLKSINIIGMINLTLLVAIMVLCSSLVNDYIRSDRFYTAATAAQVQRDNMNIAKKAAVNNTNRKVVKRKFNTTLPMKADPETNIKPQIKVVGVKKPMIVKELSFPASELPKQNLGGDVVIDSFRDTTVLSNGVKVNGNLFIQNMRKYTLPCDAEINGNLFIRNVDHLRFCGGFTVKGNIYVNRQSAFGPIPDNAKITGQVIL